MRYPHFLVVVVFVIGFTNLGCKTVSSYGGRWIDSDDWQQLKVGMTKNEVLSILGEPYMITEARKDSNSIIEIIQYKTRSKHTVVKQTTGGANSAEIKPDKKSWKFTNWGEWFDFYCSFKDGILIKYNTVPGSSAIDQ